MSAIHFDFDNVNAGTAYEAGHPYTFTVCGDVVTLRTFTVTGKATTIRADHKGALRAEILAAHAHATRGVDMGDDHDCHVIMMRVIRRGDMWAYDVLCDRAPRSNYVNRACGDLGFQYDAHCKAADVASTVAPVVVATIPANAAGEAAIIFLILGMNRMASRF